MPGDATANPYLALAAVGAAVCLGVADKIEPGDKLEGYGYDPARAQLLPVRLADALDALEADVELTEVLGGYFVSSFLAYKRNEIGRFEGFVTDWEFREYAYHLGVPGAGRGCAGRGGRRCGRLRRVCPGPGRRPRRPEPRQPPVT